ncbi:MAG: hypothetical protein Ct9H90mP5_07240 [Acidimicrobiaceae bacterium]|nr:MAG: hypothetical protein Ct9H90mP5_07240 [Acidimicrobiaceae bacterium]
MEILGRQKVVTRSKSPGGFRLGLNAGFGLLSDQDLSRSYKFMEKRVPEAAALPQLLFLAIVAFVGVTFVQVWFQSSVRDKSADAIVVLGAAQWDGIPSPVLKARLDHALDLYAKE